MSFLCVCVFKTLIVSTHECQHMCTNNLETFGETKKKIFCKVLLRKIEDATQTETFFHNAFNLCQLKHLNCKLEVLHVLTILPLH